MNIAERIYTEVQCMPEEQAHKVLNFIHSLERQTPSDEDAKAALAKLIANPLPPKGDGLPMKRGEIYDVET